MNFILQGEQVHRVGATTTVQETLTKKEGRLIRTEKGRIILFDKRAFKVKAMRMNGIMETEEIYIFELREELLGIEEVEKKRREEQYSNGAITEKEMFNLCSSITHMTQSLLLS